MTPAPDDKENEDRFWTTGLTVVHLIFLIGPLDVYILDNIGKQHLLHSRAFSSITPTHNKYVPRQQHPVLQSYLIAVWRDAQSLSQHVCGWPVENGRESID